MRSNVTCDYYRDADGAMLSARVRWDETQPAFEQGAGVLIIILGMLGLMLMIGSVVAGLFMWALAAAIFMAVVRLAGRPRSLVFMADGKIRTPNGIPSFEGASKLRAEVDDISSFEARHTRGKKDGLSEVVLITDEGDVVRISENLLEDDALKVAVQLTKATDKLRRELGDLVVSSMVPAGPWGDAVSRSFN